MRENLRASWRQSGQKQDHCPSLLNHNAKYKRLLPPCCDFANGVRSCEGAGQSPERGVGFRHGLCCASWAALRRARLAMASKATQRPLIEHFSALKDPRQIWKVVYPLPEIMLLVLCATLAGAEDFVEVRLWGAKNLDFLRRFLPFKDGLPSHDTLNDVINALDPALFKTCFVAWVRGLARRRARYCRHRPQASAAHAQPPQGPRAVASRLRLGGPS